MSASNHILPVRTIWVAMSSKNHCQCYSINFLLRNNKTLNIYWCSLILWFLFYRQVVFEQNKYDHLGLDPNLVLLEPYKNSWASSLVTFAKTFTKVGNINICFWICFRQSAFCCTMEPIRYCQAHVIQMHLNSELNISDLTSQH